MDKVGDTDMKVMRSCGEIVPKDFAAAVKDIKLAILQSRARAAYQGGLTRSPEARGAGIPRWVTTA